MFRNKMNFIQFIFGLQCLFGCYAAIEAYRVGVGRADCTGPPVEIVFMGYANMKQRGQGLHLRQFSRSFIIDDGQRRVVFVSVDGAMISHAVKRDVVDKLQLKYGKMYELDNVMISGTHTHGTPGGFMMHLLYDMSTFGFVPETYRALVSGIFNSIVRAHENVQNGRIYIDKTEIFDANINRSPTSYLANSEDERSQYKFDTDKMLTQMRFINDNNEYLGIINWFAVHPTSMNNTNKLVTSDNVGFASVLLEKELNPNDQIGQGKIVAAFASANLGDSSPNTAGPKCENSGNSCDLLTSSCPAAEGACFASGPGRDQFESCKIIGTRLFEGANSLIKNGKGREVKGDVKYIHQFIDMPSARAKYYNRKTGQFEMVRGCSPAMGYSFAAGTTDGPGVFDFTQGTTTDNPLWNTVRNFLAPPTPEDVQCQSPKPILLATGRVKFPYSWQPKIVPTQLFQIGDVVFAALPGEFTTMSGRRVRNTIRDSALQLDPNSDVQVILAGLSNIYTSYVTTPEEYEMQRYEAASTIFGPHTLTIYLSQYEKLMHALIQNSTLDPGPTPISLENKVISLQPPVFFDSTPLGKRFGDVTKQPEAEYNAGDQANVQFISGNPRNNLQHEKTYFTVEKLMSDGNWTVIATDANWETSFAWKRTSFVLGHSTMDIFWNIPKDVEPGEYRIRHFGSARHIFGEVFRYIGRSRPFSVV